MVETYASIITYVRAFVNMHDNILHAVHNLIYFASQFCRIFCRNMQKPPAMPVALDYSKIAWVNLTTSWDSPAVSVSVAVCSPST